MKKLSLILFSICFSGMLLAQETTPTNKPYLKSASELIFSFGAVEAIGPATGGTPDGKMDINPIVRFTMFFHLQEQLHYDFSNRVGIFTGLGIRNVGMINDLNDSIKAKQRVYSLGLPLAIKVGNLPNGFYVAAGAEAELFFHYKQKVFYDDEKFKKDEWFSDKVNLFNPSVFLDINSGKGGYLRFKYYLLDFLVEDKQDIKVYGIPYEYRPEKSTLFYIAVGTTLKSKKGNYKKGKTDAVDTAFNLK